MQAFTEQALLLGPRKSMVGVLTQAPPATGAADKPLVVILNSGILHRVGTCRMSVGLARALAGVGWSSVRFDLSGIGDSEPRTDGLAPLDAALADIKEVLDSLESSRKIKRVVLVGLCSGAVQALIQGGNDPRVVGAVLLDPPIPLTRQHYLHHYRKKLTNPDVWKRLVRGQHPAWRAFKARVANALEGRSPAAPAEAEEPADMMEPNLEQPEVKAYLESAFTRALEGGIQFMVVITGERRSYREQLLDAFPNVPFGSRLRLEYFANADHLFTLEGDRLSAIRMIVEWTDRTTFRGVRA